MGEIRTFARNVCRQYSRFREDTSVCHIETLLSIQNPNSTFVMCRGADWRPSKWLMFQQVFSRDFVRTLERHELRIVSGGLSSNPFDDWMDHGLQDIIDWQNGHTYGDAEIMGEQFSDWMAQGHADALRDEWFHSTSPYDIPTNADASVVAAITAFLFGLIGIDTGFDPQTGLRRDGLPAGAGCGDVSTNFIVPDKIWGIDLTAGCTAHDQNYANQIGKDAADQALRNDVKQAALNHGAPEWAASLLGGIYYTAVHNLGQGAYDAAGQRASGGSTGGGSTGGGSTGGGSTGGGGSPGSGGSKGELIEYEP